MHRHRHHGFSGMKTAALLAAVAATVLGIGSLWGPGGLGVGLVLALAMNAFVYFRSDAIALRSMRARPVSEVEQPILHRIVRELSMSARQPMPRLYVSPTMAPNAFATGRNPRNAAVCCTAGLLATLDERELRAVVGHELAHVHNRDILIRSVAAAVASVVVLVASAAWLLPFGRDDDDEAGNPLGFLLLLVLAPLAACIVRLGISRSREYQADAAAAAVTGDPLALASALRKLESGTRRLPLPPEPELQTTSALMIVDPFRREGMTRLFSTHPPVGKRIARLEGMAGYRR